MVLTVILSLNTQWLEAGGLGLVAALVFVETGFLLGLIIPGGETLLFTTGLLAGINTFQLPIWAIILILIGAAILGDLTGFWLGQKLGKRLENLPDTFLFKRRYWEQSEGFYRRHPRRALLVGRFLPIIRTFNPLLAAGSGLTWGRFLGLTAPACFLYVTLLVLAGYWLGQQFPQLGQYVEYIFLGVVVLVLGTLAYKAYREHRRTTA